MTRYRFIGGQASDFKQFKMIKTLPNFGVGQLIMWIGTTNDHIIKFIWTTIYNMIISCSNSHITKLTKIKIR